MTDGTKVAERIEGKYEKEEQEKDSISAMSILRGRNTAKQFGDVDLKRECREKKISRYRNLDS